LDLYHVPASQNALCVVIDYKSSQKQLDPVLIAHGLQLQLLTYLNVVRQWPNSRELFGAVRLDPAGVFYVNLKGSYGRERNRVQALADPQRSRKEAYRHYGRFDVSALPHLDRRTDVQEGDQFNYRLTKSGQVNKSCKEALDAAKFEDLLCQVQDHLRTMGQRIYAGSVEVEPYRKGADTACAQCTYHAICRIDPWTHRFRVLRRAAVDEAAAAQEGNEVA
jgi:ATP-dependent helicase/nuclease subunit B